MTALACLLYHSETSLRPDSVQARELLETARRVNAELDLTGSLHHEDGFFCQWLEGPSEPLARIARKIEADPRHVNLVYLTREPLDRRRFAGWTMRYSTRSEGSVITWLADQPRSARGPDQLARSLLAFLQTGLSAG